MADTKNNHKKHWDTRGRTGSIYTNGYHVQQLDGERLYTHRRIMENHLGRRLKSSEHVHHKDGNKLNNDIDNLEVITQHEHLRNHALKNGLGKDRVGVEPTNKTDKLVRELILDLRQRGWYLKHIQEFTGLSWPTVQKYAKGAK